MTVTSTADAGGSCPGASCTLRQAIATAEAGDTIDFSLPANSTIMLTSGELLINKNLFITGPGANLLSVQRSNVSGTPDFRIFQIAAANVSATISGVTIANGRATGDFPANRGSGIRNLGTLTISNSVISGNVASLGGGGFDNAGTLTITNSTISDNNANSGGGISNGGSVMVTNSTISGNSAGFGAGIDNTAMVTITNSTISGNSSVSGGGINNGGGTVTITNSTLSANTASNSGGGVFNNTGTLRARNTIIALNTAPTSPDAGQGTTGAVAVTSQGYNLIGSNSGATITPTTGDQIGVAAAQLNLSPLQDNGGPTRTHAPLSGNAAIDKGHSSGSNTDQRGGPRPIDRFNSNAAGGDGSDIGAVELAVTPQQTGPTFTVTTTVERNDGGCAIDDCSLVEALNLTNAVADANTINFAPGLTGAIGTAILTPSGLAITNPVTINGPDPRMLGVTGRTSARGFNVTSPNVTISGLGIINGKVTNGDGGIIRNTGGLTLRNCILNNGFAAGGSSDGGAIHNGLGASLTLDGCTVRDSKADAVGGGIFNEGLLTATNCTFSMNTAVQGGGIYSAFSNNASKVSLRNCTITKCGATDLGTGTGDGGGGWYAVGNSGQYNLGNTIIAGNTAARNPDLRGNFFSDGHNLIRDVGFSSGLTNAVKGDQIGTAGSPREALLVATLENNGGPTDTHALQSGSTARDNGDDALAPPADQRGFPRAGISDIGAFEFGSSLPTPTPTPTPTATPTTLANISTRLRVETGDNVLIGGFIITGTQPKKVIIRAIGPSLPFAGRLENPTLELRDGAGTLLDSNDDWMSSLNKQAIIDTTIPPSNGLESAVVATLAANGAGYTAIVRGVNDSTGIGVVEAYDLDRSVDSKLANISTRGFVSTGDNVLIAGTIVLGQATQKVIIRAIGPSLPIAGKLENPLLELRDSNGALLEANDNWVDSPNKQAIIDTTIPPSNDLESAIVATLTANGASYTAIVRGVNDSIGIAVVEVYALQ